MATPGIAGARPAANTLGVEVYHGRAIAYGLGNVLFDQHWEASGMLLRSR